MEKILSICIPSYNMEKYLDRSVGSLLVPEVLDKLEIIIVNDGSKDRTLEIANGYKAKYPQSVIVIDKPNGHYGSTVNAALKIATGKYFRILDADDWFNSEALVKFVAKLEELDVDCVYTHFSVQREDISYMREVPGLHYNQVFDITKQKINFPSPSLVMHSLSFKTEFLNEIEYVQMEGICYTDTEYVYYPLVNARTIYFTNINLYQYFLGRNEQSMSKLSMAKSNTHFKQILDKMASTNIKSPNLMYKEIRDTLSVRLLKFYLYASLILCKPSRKESKQIREFVFKIEKIDNTVVRESLVPTLYKVPIYKLWYKKSLFTAILLPIIQHCQQPYSTDKI